MRIFVDIDNTICTQEKSYELAKPIPGNIVKINEMFDNGHDIIYWTARGQSSHIDWREITQKQLHEWGCKYHDLKMDKPSYDLLIDDKSLTIEDV
jgi:hypothetical protein